MQTLLKLDPHQERSETNKDTIMPSFSSGNGHSSTCRKPNVHGVLRILVFFLGASFFLTMRQIYIVHSLEDNGNSFTSEAYNGFLRVENDVSKETINVPGIHDLQPNAFKGSRRTTHSDGSSLGSDNVAFSSNGKPQELASNSSARVTVTPGKVPRFWEVHDEVVYMLRDAPEGNLHYRTAFSKATVVTRAPWLKAKKFCHKRCCGEPMAISLDQDETHIRSNVDGMDLSDTEIQMFQNTEHLDFLAQNFNEDILPCLQPGVIINLDNHLKVNNYFWFKLREQIKVPFVLIASKSDSWSPVFEAHADQLADRRLIRWYATNPNGAYKDRPKFRDNKHKFIPFPLGLSHFHEQEKYLSPYLRLTNFSNPFLDKSRWTDLLEDELDFERDIFVQFGLRLPHRQKFFKALCPANTTEGINCNPSPAVTPDVWYSEASKYKFGISPFGHGFDCYRTYELLLLGVIPIIERSTYSLELFKDLPVIHIPGLVHMKDRGELMSIVKTYISRPTFQKSLYEGWERLFLKYWRRKMLKDAKREIIRDDCGKEYYVGWRYSPTNQPRVYCSDDDKCEIIEGRTVDHPALGHGTVTVAELMKNYAASE